MNEIKSVSIIGMGALGILYGEYFSRKLGNKAFTFIANKERIEKYKKQGVFCNGRKCDFSFNDSSKIEKPVDLLIFAVKGNDLENAMRDAEKAVGENTIIVSLLNGIVSEEIIGDYFGKEHIVYCVAQGMDAVKLGNRLTYKNMGQIIIGLPKEDKYKYSMLEAVSRLFGNVGFEHTIDEDIKRRIWSKWMLNVGVNQVVMVEEGYYGTVQKPGKAREIMVNAMQEVVLLAGKEGILLTEKDIEDYLRLVDSMDPEGMPSMRQDGLERRYSEVEFFSGTVIEKARKYGLEVPINEFLYKRIKDIELKY